MVPVPGIFSCRSFLQSTALNQGNQLPWSVLFLELQSLKVPEYAVNYEGNKINIRRTEQGKGRPSTGPRDKLWWSRSSKRTSRGQRTRPEQATRSEMSNPPLSDSKKQTGEHSYSKMKKVKWLTILKKDSPENRRASSNRLEEPYFYIALSLLTFGCFRT